MWDGPSAPISTPAWEQTISTAALCSRSTLRRTTSWRVDRDPLPSRVELVHVVTQWVSTVTSSAGGVNSSHVYERASSTAPWIRTSTPPVACAAAARLVGPGSHARSRDPARSATDRRRRGSAEATGDRSKCVNDSLRTNADDRLPGDPLGRIEGGDGIVEGRDVADVRPQSSVPHPLDNLTQ